MEPCLRFPGQVLPNGSGILAEKWGAQGGTPSPVINGVIAPMSKVKQPQFTYWFSGLIINYNSIYNW